MRSRIMSKVMSRRKNNSDSSSNSSSLVDINILSSEDDSDDFFDRQSQHAQLSGANNNNELIIPMNVLQFHLNETDSNEEVEMSDGESHFEVEDRLDRDNGSDSESAAEGNERVLQFNNVATENFIFTTIKEWATAPGVLSMSKLDDLLHRLSRTFFNLPKSYKTLLSNPNINVDNLNDGHFWYMGIKENLDSFTG